MSNISLNTLPCPGFQSGCDCLNPVGLARRLLGRLGQDNPTLFAQTNPAVGASDKNSATISVVDHCLVLTTGGAGMPAGQVLLQTVGPNNHVTDFQPVDTSGCKGCKQTTEAVYPLFIKALGKVLAPIGNGGSLLSPAARGMGC